MSDIFWAMNPDVDLSAAALPAVVDDQPVAEKWGDALKTGKYQHPVTGQKLSISGDDLDAIVKNFNGMKADGLQVPIVTDHREDAGSARGWVTAARRVGDTLKLLHKFIGADGIKASTRNKISLKLHRNFIDGRGKSHGMAFSHSSLTPSPVIPGLAGFIAASRGTPGESALDVFVLSSGAQLNPDQKLKVEVAEIRRRMYLPAK